MTEPTMGPPTIRRLVHLLAVAAIAFGLAGCSLIGGDTTGGSVLMTVEARGGRCVDGECRTTIVIDRAGAVSGARNGVAIEGQIDAALLGPLVVAVDSTDYAAIMAVPFADLCPTAVDGQEVTFTFRPTGRAEVTFSSCEVEIDFRHPLFIALEAALAPIR